jgi:hypothetical protein
MNELKHEEGVKDHKVNHLIKFNKCMLLIKTIANHILLSRKG